MAEIGKYNTLKVVKEVDFGVYLDGNEHGEILLPNRYVPENINEGDSLEVFIYLDSEDRIIATTEEPLATVDEFAYLEVKAVTSLGAFLDWGLPKDLLVPFREQKTKMEEGKKYIVYIYFDIESKRIAASAKLDKFVDNLPVEYEEEQKVELLIVNKTDLGFNAIIEDAHYGVLYANEIFTNLTTGQRIFGYIKKIREDEKIDLSLYKPGYQQIDDTSEIILDYLKNNNGKLLLTDKSTPEEISNTFGISKKNFKKAIGNLYKRKLINISDDGISLV